MEKYSHYAQRLAAVLFSRSNDPTWVELQMRMLLKELPELAMGKYCNGGDDVKTLLHWVCCLGASVSLPFVETIYEYFPEAISIKGGRVETLPLHDACRQGCSVPVITFLAHAYPGALHEKDYQSKVPWTYAYFCHNQRRQLASLLHGSKATMAQGRVKWESGEPFPQDFLAMGMEFLKPCGLHLTLEARSSNMLCFHGVNNRGHLNITLQYNGGYSEVLPMLSKLKCPIVELTLRTSESLHVEIIKHLASIDTLVVEAVHTPEQLGALLASLSEGLHLKSLVLDGNRNYHRNEGMEEHVFDSLDRLLSLEYMEVKAFPTSAAVPAIARLVAHSTTLSHVILGCPLSDDASRQLADALSNNVSVSCLTLERRVHSDCILDVLEHSNYTLTQVKVALATFQQRQNMDYYCRLNQLSRNALADLQTTKGQVVKILSLAMDENVSYLYSLLRFKPDLWSSL